MDDSQGQQSNVPPQRSAGNQTSGSTNQSHKIDLSKILGDMELQRRKQPLIPQSSSPLVSPAQVSKPVEKIIPSTPVSAAPMTPGSSFQLKPLVPPPPPRVILQAHVLKVPFETPKQVAQVLPPKPLSPPLPPPPAPRPQVLQNPSQAQGFVQNPAGSLSLNTSVVQLKPAVKIDVPASASVTAPSATFQGSAPISLQKIPPPPPRPTPPQPPKLPAVLVQNPMMVPPPIPKVEIKNTHVSPLVSLGSLSSIKRVELSNDSYAMKEEKISEAAEALTNLLSKPALSAPLVRPSTAFDVVTSSPPISPVVRPQTSVVAPQTTQIQKIDVPVASPQPPVPIFPKTSEVAPAPKAPLAEKLPTSTKKELASPVNQEISVSVTDEERMRNYVDTRLEDEGFFGKNPGTSQVAWKLIENISALSVVNGGMPSEEQSRDLHVNHRLHEEAYKLVRDVANKMKWTPREGQTVTQFLMSAAAKGPLF